MKTTPKNYYIRRGLLALGCFLFGASLVLAQSEQLNDKFSDSERSTQTLPASAAWSTSAATGLSVASQQLVFAGDAAGAQHIVAYFRSSGSPQALTVGDTLTLSFDFSVTSPLDISNGFRFGLLNSGGSRITTDNQGISNAAYNAWTGYVAWVNPGGTSGTSFAERSGTGTTLIASTAAFSGVGSGVASQTLTAGTTYNCVMTITRTSSGVDLALQFSGGSLSGYTLTASDTSPTAISFDAVAFDINRQTTPTAAPAIGTLTLDNVYVAYSPLLNDAFTDAERATQALPGTAAWYASAPSTGLTVASQQLAFAGDASSAQHIVTYFTPSGTPQSLAVGENLVVSFAFKVTSPLDLGNGWRFGVFDSGGNRVTADNLTINDSNYTAWKGYVAWVNPGGTGGASFAERTGTSTTLIASATPYTTVGSSVASQVLSAGVTYTGVLTVARTASGVDLSLNLSGGSLSSYTLAATDTSPTTTSFDALAFDINRQTTPTNAPAIGTLTLDDVTVTHTYQALAPSVDDLAFGGAYVGGVLTASDTPAWKWIGRSGDEKMATMFPSPKDFSPTHVRMHFRARRGWVYHTVSGQSVLKDAENEYTGGDGGRPYIEVRLLTSQSSSGVPDMTAGGLLYSSGTINLYPSGQQSAEKYDDSSGTILWDTGWRQPTQSEEVNQWQNVALTPNAAKAPADRVLVKGQRYAVIMRNSVVDNSRWCSANLAVVQKPMSGPDSASGYTLGSDYYDGWKSVWYSGGAWNMPAMSGGTAGHMLSLLFELYDDSTQFGFGYGVTGSGRQYEYVIGGNTKVREEFTMASNDTRTTTGFRVRCFRYAGSGNLTIKLFETGNSTALATGTITRSNLTGSSPQNAVDSNTIDFVQGNWDTNVQLQAGHSYNWELSAASGANYYAFVCGNPKRDPTMSFDESRDLAAAGGAKISTDNGSTWDWANVWSVGTTGSSLGDLDGALITTVP